MFPGLAYSLYEIHKFRTPSNERARPGIKAISLHHGEISSSHPCSDGVHLLVTLLSEGSLDSARVETALTRTVMQVGRELGLNVMLSNLLRFGR